MTPKGHCFFCDDLTEYAVGKIPICEYCGHELLDLLRKAEEIVHKYDKIDEPEISHEEDIFDCDCESCTRQQRLHIEKMNEGVE